MKGSVLCRHCLLFDAERTKAKLRDDRSTLLKLFAQFHTFVNKLLQFSVSIRNTKLGAKFDKIYVRAATACPVSHFKSEASGFQLHDSPEET